MSVGDAPAVHERADDRHPEEGSGNPAGDGVDLTHPRPPRSSRGVPLCSVTMEMQYRRLGHSGLRVSVLSFGSWVSFGPQLAGANARDCLAAAYDAGINFFDNA